MSSGDDTALLLKSLMQDVEKKGAHSSSLNFADTLLMVQGVKLIGAATSADGVYMDVRSVDLPSGRGSVTFAQKVERGGGRAALEYYVADIAYEGAWSDSAVRKWVMGVVKGR